MPQLTVHIQLALSEHWPAKRYRGRRYRRNDQLWCTAIHEAGHAAFAHALNLPFTEVTIRPSFGGALGHVETRWSDMPAKDSAHRIVSVATILVARAVAEEALACRPNLRIRKPGSDYDQLDRLLEGVPGADGIIESVERHVGESLLSIQVMAMGYRLADALMVQTSLDHAQVVATMTGGGSRSLCT